MPFEKGVPTGFGADKSMINRTGKLPRAETMTALLKIRLEQEFKYKGKKYKGKDGVAQALVLKALDKNDKHQLAAIKYIFDRIDGLPTQTVNNNLQSVYVIQPEFDDATEKEDG